MVFGLVLDGCVGTHSLTEPAVGAAIPVDLGSQELPPVNLL